MVQKKIGVVTIGQTPRPDIEKLIDEILGEEYKVIIKGALDELELKDIPEFRDDEYLLMTSMRDVDGQRKGVRVTREFLIPLIQEKIHQLEDKVEVIIVWCAGRFPEFESKVFIVRPCEVLKGIVDVVLKRGRLGVIYPSPLQLIWAEPEWKRDGIHVYGDSPRGVHSREKEVELLANRLATQELDLILLNCTGFGYGMKKIIRDKTNTPVIQANALTLRIVKELLH